MIKETDSRTFFRQLVAPKEHFPMYGQWEITCRCNLKCVMCYTDCFNTPEKIRQEISSAEIFRIMDELKEAGVFGLTLTGGEPLAHPDFKEIYRYSWQCGFLMTVYTNGTLITEEIANFWLKMLPDRIEISMHGLEEDFDKITAVQGSFEKCLRGIRLLVERKIPLTLKTVGMTLNKDQVLKIQEYVRAFENVNWYFGETMRPALDGSMDPLRFQLSESELLEIEGRDSKMLQEKEKQKNELEEEKEKPLKNHCGSQFKFHIDAYGGLQLCSKKRSETYDLRRGSFEEGFYEALPRFYCPKKPQSSLV